MTKLFKFLWAVSMIACGMGILLRVMILNDPHCAFRDDPVEEWIAIGVAFLLINAGHKSKL